MIYDSLRAWIISFLDQPNDKLNGWSPCPYAKTALNNDKIHFLFDNDLVSAVNQNKHILEDKDVLVIGFDKNIIQTESLISLVRELNENLSSEGIVILEDHPDHPEYINGVQMNFGDFGLLLVQKSEKLRDASDKLLKAGYYDCWSKENMDEVVNWRT